MNHQPIILTLALTAAAGFALVWAAAQILL